MSKIRFTEPNREILARRDSIINDLTRLVDPAGLITSTDECRAYETDALTAYRKMPLAVVLPKTTEEVSAVLKYCHDTGVKVVPRGAGTSLAGGAIPSEDAVVLGLSKMNRVLAVNYDDRFIRVEAGVTNLSVTAVVAENGFFYAPDPSSQLACTIGGNIANNSGGAHCLKYGVTTNNLLGVRMVLIDGSIIDLGGDYLDSAGLDLLGLVVGSEGQLGIVTEATLRILKSAEGARPVLFGFPSCEGAGKAVADVIAAGIIPVAIEYMDKAAIEICEAFAKAGYPLDVEALLIVEVESAFGATGRVADYLCMDGTVPTGKLSYVLAEISKIVQRHGLRVANVFHAGDGNMHPLILYNANDPSQQSKAEAAGDDILRLCVEVGGCLTGEHGVGIEKRDLMRCQFDDADLAQQIRVRAAFDPRWLLNTDKVFPLDFRCQG